MRSDKRRTTFTEQARRTQIVEATTEVLAESGYAAASLAAIAERVGVSKGVISYYFAGKDELLQEVVTSVVADAAQYMRPRIQAASSSLEALRAYVTSNLDYIDGHRSQILAITELVNATAPGSNPAPPYPAGHLQAVEDVARLLRKGQRAGEFGQFTPAHIALALRASIDAVAELLRADPDMDVRAYGTEVADLFERGVRA